MCPFSTSSDEPFSKYLTESILFSDPAYVDKTSPNSVPERNQGKDQIFDDIEIFLREYETPSTLPLTLKQNQKRIYQSTKDLLNVLDSDMDKQKSKKDKNKTVPTASIPPKKRPITKPQEASPAKKIKTKKKEETSKTKSNKLKRPVKAKVNKYVEPKYIICKKLFLPRKRKVKVSEHQRSKHKAKVSVVTCRCDSRTLNQIKKEVTDLTGDGDIFHVYLRFAEEHYVQEGSVQEFEVTKAKANVVVEDFHHKATIFIPEVVCNYETCFDLTLSDEEDKETVVMSEKECANQIVPIIYKCHKIHEANKKVEQALYEIQECLSPNENYFKQFQFFTRNTSALGYNLEQTLSKIYVKNINMPRFIEIITSKLEAQHGVRIQPQIVNFYLKAMLCHRDSQNWLITEIMKAIDVYAEWLRLKEERDEEKEKVMFTKDQLGQLQCQINKYNEIAMIQDQLMVVHDQNFHHSFPDITRAVKVELLSRQDEFQFLHVKTENDVICIDD